VKRATLGRRFAAALIDLFGMYVVHGAVLVYALTAGLGSAGGTIRPAVVADFVALVAFGALEMTGASLGKRALKLRVRSKSGQSPGGLRLGGRWLLRSVPIAGCFAASLALTLMAAQGGNQSMAIVASSTLSGMLLCVALIDLLFSLGSSRRALHDFIAGTSVVDIRD